MPDVFDSSKRSEVMSHIRASGNQSTEIALIKAMRHHGIKGWRRHQTVMGRPDFVFRSARVAVFVDGCFWHGCPKHCQMPGTNQEYWKSKLETNRNRDLKVIRELRKQGWCVIRIWEHELSDPERVIRRLRRVLEKQQNSQSVNPRAAEDKAID
jgi:DNA mismatch endonuclease, patch repair protein